MTNAVHRGCHGVQDTQTPHFSFDASEPPTAAKSRHESLFYAVKAALLLIGVMSGVTAFAAGLPDVTSVILAPGSATRSVQISYTLAQAPAVITLDIQTNAVANAADGWVTIGGENIQNLNGRVNERIDETGTYLIEWKADQSWEGHVMPVGTCRAVITAWPLDNTPDYMVVDLAQTSLRRVTYYTAPEFLPGGGLFGSDTYRTSKIVLKKIVAKNVPWTMGSIGEDGRCSVYASNPSYAPEIFHQVMLTNNYYIAVFELTQSQCFAVMGSYYSRFTGDRTMRPADEVNLKAARGNDVDYAWPGDPSSDSIVGKLREVTGNLVDFDVPSEAQWEFACRSGFGEGRWGDGSAYTNSTSDANLNRLARCKFGDGYVYDGSAYVEPDWAAGPEHGTARVGSYLPNGFGLYDMHGNVRELTLDYTSSDPSALNGAVCTDRAGALLSGSYRHIVKGGAWHDPSSKCRAAMRDCSKPADAAIGQYWAGTTGLRVVARMGLE